MNAFLLYLYYAHCLQKHTHTDFQVINTFVSIKYYCGMGTKCHPQWLITCQMTNILKVASGDAAKVHLVA